MYGAIDHCKIQTASHGMEEKETPGILTTTLYDLIAVLQDVLGPDEDELVVASVVHMLSSGGITLRGHRRH